MKRLAIALAAALIAISPVSMGSSAFAAGLPAALRTATVVEGDVIRLGDLWENAGDKAETPIANAPQPGKRVTLDARWLAAVAASYGIDWRPASAFDRVVVERAGQRIDVATVEAEVLRALAAEGVSPDSSVEITNRTALQIVVPQGAGEAVGVRDVTYDPRFKRFTAIIEAPAGSPAATRMRVQGHVFDMARIPVLKRNLARGEVITEADIQWQDVREEIVRRDVASDPAQLIGLEPRYALRAGAPIRVSDVQRPVVVTRNQPVTMVLKTPFMSLTAQGKATEDGGKGDVIRVTNLQTRQTVEARIEGPGMVSVMAGGPRTLAN